MWKICGKSQILNLSFDGNLSLAGGNLSLIDGNLSLVGGNLSLVRKNTLL